MLVRSRTQTKETSDQEVHGLAENILKPDKIFEQ